MPLVYQQNINEHTKIGVWQITESNSYFLQRVTFQYSISHPHKQLQHLAGRFLLTALIPHFPVEQIEVSKEGKPFLTNDAYFFSIAHCKDMVAAIISTNQRVGVDIEMPNVKAKTIKDKFLTPEEQDCFLSLPLPTEHAFTLAWSIKEAMYKWQGVGGVDFKKQLHIQSVETTVQGSMTAHGICIADKPIPLQLNSMLLQDCYLTWTLG